MKKSRILIIAISISVFLIVVVAASLVSMDIPWGFARSVSENEAKLRTEYVQQAEQWLGKNSQDGSHQDIIDLYNAHEPLAQGYMVTYEDKWCATFVSAAAISNGLTEIIPTECGCERQIELFRKLGCWEEADDYVPLPGDIIYYCNSDLGVGDCTDWSDHVGIVVGTYGSMIKLIEGNVNDRVAYRYILVNARTIRGYATPDYASMTNITPME